MGCKCTKDEENSLEDMQYTKLPSTFQDLVESSASARIRLKNSSIYLKNVISFF